MVRAKTDVSRLESASILDEDDKIIVNQIDSGKPITRTSTLKDLKGHLEGDTGVIAISDSPPTNANPGDLWLDNNTGILYVYYISQWIST